MFKGQIVVRCKIANSISLGPFGCKNLFSEVFPKDLSVKSFSSQVEWLFDHIFLYENELPPFFSLQNLIIVSYERDTLDIMIIRYILI